MVIILPPLLFANSLPFHAQQSEVFGCDLISFWSSLNSKHRSSPNTIPVPLRDFLAFVISHLRSLYRNRATIGRFLFKVRVPNLWHTSILFGGKVMFSICESLSIISVSDMVIGAGVLVSMGWILTGAGVAVGMVVGSMAAGCWSLKYESSREILLSVSVELNDRACLILFQDNEEDVLELGLTVSLFLLISCCYDSLICTQYHSSGITDITECK